jgi:hypothetical protein
VKWTQTATGGWTSHDGLCRWTIRGPIMGKPMFWLYRDGARFTPSGRYDDVVSFTTARKAKAFAADYPKAEMT